jgi:hypothetical protein
MAEQVNRGRAHALWAALEAEHKRYRNAVNYIPTSELKLQEDLRRYLCLRCAGFLEQLTFVGVTYYLHFKSSGPPCAFAISFFQRAPNLNVPALEKLMERFGQEIADSLATFLTSARRESLNDLLEVRNDVAHGRYQAGRKLDPGRYFEVCSDYYEWLCETFYGGVVDVIGEDGFTVEGRERVSA